MDSSGDLSRYHYEGGIDLGTLNRRPGPGFRRGDLHGRPPWVA
jgi:hypothetical protein